MIKKVYFSFLPKLTHNIQKFCEVITFQATWVIYENSQKTKLNQRTFHNCIAGYCDTSFIIFIDPNIIINKEQINIIKYKQSICTVILVK